MVAVCVPVVTKVSVEDVLCVSPVVVPAVGNVLLRVELEEVVSVVAEEVVSVVELYVDECTVEKVEDEETPGEFFVVTERTLPETELIEYDSPEVAVFEVVVPKEVYPGRLDVTEVPPPEPEFEFPKEEVEEAVVELRFGLL